MFAVAMLQKPWEILSMSLSGAHQEAQRHNCPLDDKEPARGRMRTRDGQNPQLLESFRTGEGAQPQPHSILGYVLACSWGSKPVSRGSPCNRHCRWSQLPGGCDSNIWSGFSLRSTLSGRPPKAMAPRSWTPGPHG